MKDNIHRRKISATLLDILDKRNFFYIIGHAAPDGDCVGSCLALAAFLTIISKDCQIVTSSVRDFVKIQNKIDFCADKSLQTELIEDIDVVKIEKGQAFCIFVDCQGINRTGNIYDSIRSDSRILNIIYDNSIIIDHHPNQNIRDCDFIDDTASSASELVAEVIDRKIGFSDKYICNCLFFGIASDTAFFRFSTSFNSFTTFEICSKIVSKGFVSPDKVQYAIESGKDIEYIEYYINLLENAVYLCDERVVLVVDNEKLFEKYGKQRRPGDDIYRLFLKVNKTEVVIFVKFSDIKGYADGSVRVSALSDFDANEYCRRLGGGGHKKASGFHIVGNFDEVVKKVKKEIEEYKFNY